MEWVKLGDHISQIRGVSYSKSDIKSSPCEGYVGLLRADAIQDGNIIETNLIYVKEDKVSENQYLRDGDILIAASSGSKKLVGKAAQFKKADKDLTFGAFCKVVRSEDLNKDFLKFFFKSSYYKNTISNLSAGANINNIRNSDIDNLDIILYEENFEADLVRRLNNIEKLISTRKAQIAALDELVQSVFYEMFGDPLSSNNYNKVKLEQLGKWQSGGTPSRSNTEYFNGNIPWASSGELNDMYISETLESITNEAIANSSAKMIEKGSLLLGMYDTAGLKSSINKVEMTCNQAIAFSKLKNNCSNTVFVYYVIQLLRPYLLTQQRGVRQKNFNLRMIKSIEIPLPPLELQEQFAAKVEAIEAQKAKLQTSLEEMETLFDALMQEAFSGNLG